MEGLRVNEKLTHPDSAAQLPVFLLAFVGCVFGFALSCVLDRQVSDEWFHTPQILHYYEGGREHDSKITMPSTYHYILAFIANAIGYYHLYLLRFISLLVGVCVLPVFYLMARRHYPQHAAIRTLQLLYTPLIFPYFFLVYTDVWAMLFIALCFYFSIGRQYILAGLLGFFAVVLRTDSIIWVGLAYLFVCFEGISFSRPFPYKEFLRNAVVRGMPLNIVFLLFIAFVIYNGGVAIGDPGSHKMGNFNISNLYIFLICAWVLFFALCIQQLPKIVILLKKPWMWAALAVGFLFYMGTFDNPHGYNRTLYRFFLHNGMLYLMMEYVLLRALLYIPIAWMVLTLFVMEYPDKRCYWMLPIIPIAAISHPMVDFRYYFPAFLLINLWRPPMNMTAERITLALYMVLAVYFMYGTVARWFFL